MNLKKIRDEVIFHGVVLFIGAFMLYPLLWMTFGSFKPTAEIFGTLSLIPENFTLENFVRGWRYNNVTTFTTFYRNSFVITGLSTLGAVLMSSLAAFGFARVHSEAGHFGIAACS